MPPVFPDFCAESALPFSDGEALVIDKPAGLPVSRPRKGGRSLEDFLPQLRFGFQREPQPVHRLDQDTSGCLLLARHAKALKRFGAAFESGQVSKLYWGLIEGVLAQGQGTIELALTKTSSAADGWRIVPSPQGKRAVTHWQQVAVVGGKALVEFRPETGRTHQIRRPPRAGRPGPEFGRGPRPRRRRSGLWSRRSRRLDAPRGASDGSARWQTADCRARSHAGPFSQTGFCRTGEC